MLGNARGDSIGRNGVQRGIGERREILEMSPPVPVVCYRPRFVRETRLAERQELALRESLKSWYGWANPDPDLAFSERRTARSLHLLGNALV